MKLVFVIGARPNFMKVAPILRALASDPRAAEVRRVLVHTGQHYDPSLNDSVLADVGMPRPEEFLRVGSGSHARQTARVMEGFEDVCERHLPDAVVVVGDVNSTMACALVAKKQGIRVVHVEAGLRSNDWSMPEEVNRTVTDRISDLLLTPSADADENLLKEGVDPARIRLVGNVMIDSLRDAVRRLGDVPSKLGDRARRGGLPVALVTLHRPANVDDVTDLMPILEGLRTSSARLAAFFPLHPRTAQKVTETGLRLPEAEPDDPGPLAPGLYAMPALGYLDFLNLMRGSAIVLTDSGGVQEETTALGIPCATLRSNTERPVTITLGTNELVPRTASGIEDAVDRALSGRWKTGCLPPLWDGEAAGRIVDALLEPGWRAGTTAS